MNLSDEDRCEELENIIDDIVAEINAVKEKYIEEKETVEERLVKEKIAEQGAQIIEFIRSRI